MNKSETSEMTFEYAREAHERWLIKNNKNDLDKAIEYYSKTLRNNPSIAESYYRLALLLWESGQISLTSALDKCRSALAIYPKSVDARLYYGYFLKLAGKTKEAEYEFKKAVQLSPILSSRAKLNLGLFYAESLFSGEFSLSNAFCSGYYLTAGMISGLFDYGCIKMSLTKIRENFNVNKYLAFGKTLNLLGFKRNAEKIFRKGSIKTGRFEIFNKLIGDINVEKENISSALKSYKKVLKSNSYDREALLKTATILQTYYQDRVDEAIQSYSKALFTDGDKAYIYYELGHLYLKKDDFINAVNAFKLAVDEDNTNAFFHNALGFAYFRACQFDEAEDHYLIAINLNPDPEWTATVCRAVALIYSDVRKKPEKAIRMYMQSLSLMPDCEDTYSALGDLYFEQEDYDKAVENYSKALSINSRDVHVNNQFATSLYKKGFIEDAMIAYKNTIDADENYAPAYNNLGAVYLENKNMIAEAKDCFEKAVEKDEKYTTAYFNLARTYELSDDRVNAAKFYGKALELNAERQEISNEETEEKLHSLFDV